MRPQNGPVEESNTASLLRESRDYRRATRTGGSGWVGFHICGGPRVWGDTKAEETGGQGRCCQSCPCGEKISPHKENLQKAERDRPGWKILKGIETGKTTFPPGPTELTVRSKGGAKKGGERLIKIQRCLASIGEDKKAPWETWVKGHFSHESGGSARERDPRRYMIYPRGEGDGQKS